MHFRYDPLRLRRSTARASNESTAAPNAAMPARRMSAPRSSSPPEPVAGAPGVGWRSQAGTSAAPSNTSQQLIAPSTLTAQAWYFPALIARYSPAGGCAWPSNV